MTAFKLADVGCHGGEASCLDLLTAEQTLVTADEALAASDQTLASNHASVFRRWAAAGRARPCPPQGMIEIEFIRFS